MDTSNPYESENKSKKKKDQAPPSEEKESKNIYDSMTDDDLEDEDLEDRDESLDDPEGSEFDDDEVPWFKKPAGMIGIGVGIIVVGLIIYFVFIKKDPPPPPAPTEQTAEAPDPTEVLKGELYKKGIGKDAIDEKNIYEQGPIESADFRKDFVNTDAPENYVLPIKIAAVNDSVSYTKHRTMTDDGIDMYWADATYKDKKTRFTVPYYIWQTLAPQGVMDVITEVVTDAEGNTFVTSITAVPPNTGE